MKTIDEIALEVIEERGGSRMEDQDDLIDFAHRLLAEVKKEMEPVGVMIEETVWTEWRDERLQLHREQMQPSVLRAAIRVNLPVGTKLYTHPAPAIPPGWQPIETAPKEERFLATDDEYDYIELVVDHGDEDLFCLNSHNYTRRAAWKYWMPLPAAPTPEGEKR